MRNTFLYFTTVLLWGSSWYATKLQVLLGPDVISLFYRSIASALFMIAWCKIRGLSLKFSYKEHLSFLALGACIFSLKYLFIYYALNYIISGMAAVIIACTSFFNIINSIFILRKKPNFIIIIGTFIGISGLCLFFWKDFYRTDLNFDTLKGIALGLVGTFIFSLGSVFSKKNDKKNIAFIPSMTLAICYGAVITTLYTFFNTQEFILPKNYIYWFSLLYLAIPSSIVGTLCYLKLVKNIGPELAGYSTVLIPVVALIFSWFLEGYIWSINDLFALFFIFLGNFLVLKKTSINQNRKSLT